MLRVILLFLLIAGLLFFIFLIRIKVSIDVKFNNLKLMAAVTIWVFEFLPIKISLFNKKGELSTFYYKSAFRKTRSIHLEKLFTDAIQNIPKEKRVFEYIKYLMHRNMKLKKLVLSVYIGIKDRADITALSVGAIKGGLDVIKADEKEVRVLPAYGCNLCAFDFSCIIRAKDANITFDSIRYFFGRK